MKFTVLLCLALALLGAGWFETVALRQHNALRRVQVAELRRQRADRQMQRGENTPPAIAETAAGHDAANASTSVDPTEVAKIRAEIAALERRAEAQHALNPELTDAPATNRDPEKGMTKLENFQNVGQGTPATAFQTLVWAALKGEDRIMAQTIGLDEAARRQMLQLMAGLPEAEREKYPTPESLLALFLAKALVRVSSLQIVTTEPRDAQNATICVRGLMGNDQNLPMRLGATGWQLWEGEKNVEWLRSEFAPRRKN